MGCSSLPRGRSKAQTTQRCYWCVVSTRAFCPSTLFGWLSDRFDKLRFHCWLTALIQISAGLVLNWCWSLPSKGVTSSGSNHQSNHSGTGSVAGCHSKCLALSRKSYLFSSSEGGFSRRLKHLAGWWTNLGWLATAEILRSDSKELTHSTRELNFERSGPFLLFGTPVANRLIPTIDAQIWYAAPSRWL